MAAAPPTRFGPFANRLPEPRSGTTPTQPPSQDAGAPSPLELCAFGAAFACDAEQWDAAVHGTPLVPVTPCIGNQDVPLGFPIGPKARWVRYQVPDAGW